MAHFFVTLLNHYFNPHFWDICDPEKGNMLGVRVLVHWEERFGVDFVTFLFPVLLQRGLNFVLAAVAWLQR